MPGKECWYRFHAVIKTKLGDLFCMNCCVLSSFLDHFTSAKAKARAIGSVRECGRSRASGAGALLSVARLQFKRRQSGQLKRRRRVFSRGAQGTERGGVLGGDVPPYYSVNKYIIRPFCNSMLRVESCYKWNSCQSVSLLVRLIYLNL